MSIDNSALDPELRELHPKSLEDLVTHGFTYHRTIQHFRGGPSAEWTKPCDSKNSSTRKFFWLREIGGKITEILLRGVES